LTLLGGKPTGLTPCTLASSGCTTCNCSYVSIINTSDCDIVEVDVAGPAQVCFASCGWNKDSNFTHRWTSNPDPPSHGCLYTSPVVLTPCPGGMPPPPTPCPNIVPAPGSPSEFYLQICSSASGTFTIKIKLSDGTTCTNTIAI
jgi:hypothetical protein